LNFLNFFVNILKIYVTFVLKSDPKDCRQSEQQSLTNFVLNIFRNSSL